MLAHWERSAGWMGPTPSGASYTGPAVGDHPVLPLQVFGITYDLDLVLRSKHPTWDMHEYAMLRTPDGPVWMAKDARAATMTQSIVADLPDIQAWLPEVPLARTAQPLEVLDRSEGDWLDLQLRYVNDDGEAVEVRYEGKAPRQSMPKRNTSTMGHSRQYVLAALDLSHREFARRASIQIGDDPVPLERILGLIPFQLVLVQTQAGFSVGSFGQESLEGGFRSTHVMPDGGEVAQDWVLEERGRTVEAIQRTPMRTLRYRYLAHEGSLELAEMTVEQWGRGAPPCRVVLQPALPDLRRPFEGTVRSRYVIDVNGQPSHAVGWLEARWEEGEAVVDILPEAPEWTVDRPMQSRVRHGADGRVAVAVARVGD